MKSYVLKNALKLNKMHPKTFLIPEKDEIDRLKVNDYVKLIFEEPDNGAERMWVKITSVDDGKYEGVLDNSPVALESISVEDKVLFGSENIIDLMFS